MTQRMDRKYIDSYLVVDRYLAGDLTETETADFEDRLVWDKELVEEIDLVEKLRDGLRASAEATQQSAPQQSVAVSTGFGAGRLALAASFAAGALATSLFFNQTATMVADSGVPTQVVALELLRSNTVQQVVVTPGEMTVLMVSVDDERSSYDVELSERGDSEVIWSQSGLTPGYTASLAIGMDSALLPPGNYMLSVYAQVEGEQTLIQEVPFEAILAE